MLKTIRAAAGEAVAQIMAEDPQAVALSADTRASMALSRCHELYPSRVLDVGIAEQTMMMVASGLALEGCRPYVASYANFLALRCCGQIRSFIAYPRLPVKIFGGLAGLSAGIEGVTHLGTEDVAVLAAIPGLTVVCPSSASMTLAAVKYFHYREVPAYFRLGRDEIVPDLDSPPFDLEPLCRARGSEACIFTCGWIVHEVLAAAEELRYRGTPVEVWEVPVVRPFPTRATQDILSRFRWCFVVEEGTVRGGLGTLVAEASSTQRHSAILRRLGVDDKFLRTGTPRELYEYCGLNATSIAEAILQWMREESRDES